MLESVARVERPPKIACQGCDIAGDVDETRRAGSQHAVQRLARHPCARWIDDDCGPCGAPEPPHELLHGLSFDAHRLAEGGGIGSKIRAAYRVALDRDH